MKMDWNGKPYYDHPPMGFWLMAVSYKIFGINEFSTRFPSAILGVFSILLIFKIGEALSGKKLVGLSAALVLGTAVWFVIRVRSGNLDSPFVFFYLLTIFLSLKSQKNFKWFPMVGLAFGGLILTKTLVGASAIFLILFLNFKQFFNIKKNILLMILGIVAFLGIVFPWYRIQLTTYSDFYQHHFVNIGTRNKTLASYLNPMYEQPLFFIHMGVRKWYYLWLASLAFLIISFKFLKRNVFLILLWNFIILYPFLTSKETELWHLIPVYLPIALITSVGLYEGILFVTSLSGYLVKTRRFPTPLRLVQNDKIRNSLYLLFFLYISFVQIKIFFKEVYPANKWIPDDVAISRAAAKYGKPIFLDDDYLPIAVFYSGKRIYPLMYQPDEKKTLVKFFQSDEMNFVVITRNWAVADLDKNNLTYKLLEKNSSFSILTR